MSFNNNNSNNNSNNKSNNNSNNNSNDNNNSDDGFTESDVMDLRALIRHLPCANSNANSDTETTNENASLEPDNDQPPVFFLPHSSTSSSSIEDMNLPLNGFFVNLLEANRRSEVARIREEIRSLQYTRHSAIHPHELMATSMRVSNQERNHMFLRWRDDGSLEIWPERQNFGWQRNRINPPVFPRPLVGDSTQNVSTIGAFVIVVLLIMNRFCPFPPNFQ